MGIKRIKDFPDGSGSLSNDDILLFMDNPSVSGITKKISLSQLAATIGGGGGGGNPFDQDLNTTNTPTFFGVNLSNGTTLAQGTFDNGTSGQSGISLNCYVGYELNWQGGHLKCTQDNGVTSSNIVLDSALQFSDNVIVCSPADDLAMKYSIVKTLTPGGNALSSTNRATLIILPGNYTVESTLTIDTNYVDIIGLGSIKLNRGSIPAVNLSGGIDITANNVRVKGISVGSDSFTISGANNQIFEDCVGGNNSFGGYNVSAGGTFINCTGGNYSFGGAATSSGSFINCIAGSNSFGGEYATASGTFINCFGLTGSFGGTGGTASGSFKDCVGGDETFGGNYGTASGIFENCSGGNFSFGAYGSASGSFINCLSGVFGFGGALTGGEGLAGGNFRDCIGAAGSFGSEGSVSGILLRCILTSGSFPALGSGGKYRLCIDGSYSIINTDYLAP